jgi:omega-6 fatty acid desaturase (delta-12 desaturase)
MLQGKDLIRSTIPFTKENRVKSWIYFLSTLVMLSAALTCTFLFENLLLKPAFSILSGLLIIRQFVIYHDHQHKAILNKSVLADLLMKAFGLFVLAPSSIWKRSHDYHHAHNSKLFSASIGSYPIMTKEKFYKASPSEKRFYLFTRHPLTIAFGYIFMFIIGMCIGSFTSSLKKHYDALIALILHFVFIFLVYYFFGWQQVLFSIIIPFLIADAIGSYLFYAQHNFPGVVFASKEKWKYEDAALKSSSYMKMSPVMQWFTANIGYHHIHHMNARIPFYRLPEVMEQIKEFQQAKTTSLKIKDIIACFKLKVWDEENKQMIGV